LLQHDYESHSRPVENELLHGRVVLVSGGTRGVGAGVARAAVREGATVVVTGRRPDVGEAFAEEIGAEYWDQHVFGAVD
jgi:NAD(P)-dependent dehydrogenase (short-subunit alcohol dehydrogenase family)